MSNDIIRIFNIFLLSVGAISGSWTRYKLIGLVSKRSEHSKTAITLVNFLPCFGLGFIVAFQADQPITAIGKSLNLLFSIGFLGSMSTFSSFIFEIFIQLKSREYKQMIILALLSILGGLFAAVLGYLIGSI